MGEQARPPLRRRAVRFVIGVAAIALFCATASHLLGSVARAQTHEIITTAAIEELPSTIGVAEGGDFFAMTEEEIDRTLQELQALGVQNIRVGIPWRSVEVAPDVYDWSQVEYIVNRADELGMGVLGVMTTTSVWDGGLFDPYGHPSDPVEYETYLNEFEEFAAAAAEQFEGRVSAYEIWNEPNYYQFFNPVDAEAYTDLLKAGYEGIKSADEAALVIGGVVGATQTIKIGDFTVTLDPVDFVEQMYAAGAEGYFDALSFHPYGNGLQFTDRNDQSQLLTPIEQLEAIRELMTANGDGDLKIWLSEYGVSTEPGGLTVDEQAEYIENLIRAWQEVDGAGPVFIYTTRDTSTGAADPELNFGIFETDWDKKCGETYCTADVLAALIAELQEPTDPGDPSPTNPIAALFQQLSLALSGAFNFFSNAISNVFSAITNFIGSIFGVPAVTVAAAAVENAALMTTADLEGTDALGETQGDSDAAKPAAQGADADLAGEDAEGVSADVDPTEGVEDVDTAEGVEQVDPAEGVEDVDPAEGVEQVDPAEGVEQVDPAEGVEENAGDSTEGSKDNAGDSTEGTKDNAGDSTEGSKDNDGAADPKEDEKTTVARKDDAENGASESAGDPAE